MRTRVDQELEVSFAVERSDGVVDVGVSISEVNLREEQIEEEARGPADKLRDEGRELLDEREERVRALDEEGVKAPLLEDDGPSPGAVSRTGSFELNASDDHAR